MPGDDSDRIPDVRDGLTRIERVVLHVLAETQREWGGRNVPTATLYGRVLEHVDLSQEELHACLQRLGTLRGGDGTRSDMNGHDT